MTNVKIVVVGIGSASFGPKTLGDILSRSELSGSTLCLVDIRPEALEPMEKLATRMNEEWSTGLKIQATTDLTEALPGANFVICMLEANRDRLWQLDMQIPHKYGVLQVLGENGGPGGLSHTLRTVPLVLDVARQTEKHCPDAWFLNYTNPLPRVCRAIKKYTQVKAIGFCHGIGRTVRVIGDILDRDPDQLDIKAAGLNHFHWVLDVRIKTTGEDVYPLLREWAVNPKERHLWSDLFRCFGYLPFPSDDHVGEYLPFMHVEFFQSWKKYGHDHWLLHWDGKDVKRQTMWNQINEMIGGDRSIDSLFGGSGERAIPVLLGIRDDLNSHELALNIPNEGYIGNLPDDAIVEVPAIVNGDGIDGFCVGDLPPQIAAWCSNQVHVAELAVDAAVTGDRTVALQSLLADPVTNDIETAEKILDEYLAVHADWLPQFERNG
ncbi:MAG: alpha-glucosidase/alpha-galactosidase [bacterium]|nr:alpha-glucosidase/alpha-galactosidase [bacterium]